MAKKSLAELIRIGAKKGPQLQTQLYDEITGGSCAIGAAVLGHDEVYKTDLMKQSCYITFEAIKLLKKHGVIFIEKKFMCPNCLWEFGSLGGVITHLNDVHEWTREEIVDWVEMIEKTS